MKAIIKSVDATTLEVGCDSTDWVTKKFHDNISEKELLELAHNLHDALCPCKNSAKTYSKVEEYVGKTLPSKEDILANNF